MNQPLPEVDLAFDGPIEPLGASAWEALLACWLAQLQQELPEGLQAPAYSLGLQLCDDATIAALNGEWRQQPRPTDVLAFSALEDDGSEGMPPLPVSAGDAPLELGDIVISLDTAARQAADHGHDLREELLFLASHGLLHLLGWDHPDEASLERMLQRQHQLMAQTATGFGGMVPTP
ncbi:MAG: rRNA maturation RNase YbeY [Cyanobacteriota bacterium]|nr:rRNA maturation RNase YbeY [Cyanobacteriota bacterium]